MAEKVEQPKETQKVSEKVKVERIKVPESAKIRVNLPDAVIAEVKKAIATSGNIRGIFDEKTNTISYTNFNSPDYAKYREAKVTRRKEKVTARSERRKLREERKKMREQKREERLLARAEKIKNKGVVKKAKALSRVEMLQRKLNEAKSKIGE